MGDLLLSLGSDPKYFCGISPNSVAGSWWNASPTVMRYPCDLGQALQNNIMQEKETAEEYKNIIAYVDDNGIIAALKEILSEKKQDIDRLHLLYNRFCS